MHRNSLASWVDRGCPAAERADRASGKEWKISIPDVVEWRVKTAVDDALAGFHGEAGQISKDEADRRKAVAQARIAEIDVDERLKSVILVADATEAVTDFCMALRSGLDNGIAKTAGRASQMSDPNEIREFFIEELNRSWRAAETELDWKWGELRTGTPVDLDEAKDAPADTDNGELD